MADITWIKLDTELFNNKKIKKIRRLPDGDKILLVWIYLLVNAGKCNMRGYICLTENIPIENEDIAIDLNYDINIIKLAIETFKMMNMIQVDENNNIEILNWGEYQSVDKLDEIREKNRLRQQRYRQKLLLEDKTKKENKRDNVSVTLPNIYECEYFSISEEKHNEYKELYNIDLIKEYKKMKIWLDDNPSKRKTPKGYPRFISSWLSRSNENRSYNHVNKDEEEVDFYKNNPLLAKPVQHKPLED